MTRRWVSRIEWARYSRPGIASSAKLTVNLMLFSGVATLAEAITVARAGGLGNEEIRDLLAESPVVAPGIRNRFQAVLDASGPTWWTTELGAKDARLATELVQAAGCISVRSSETRTRRPPMPASATTTGPPGTERGSAGPTDAPTHQVLHFYPTADNVHYVKLERNSRDGVRRTVARALPPGTRQPPWSVDRVPGVPRCTSEDRLPTLSVHGGPSVESLVLRRTGRFRGARHPEVGRRGRCVSSGRRVAKRIPISTSGPPHAAIPCDGGKGALISVTVFTKVTSAKSPWLKVQSPDG